MASHATFCLYEPIQAIFCEKPGVDEGNFGRGVSSSWMNVGKVLEYIPMLTTCMTN